MIQISNLAFSYGPVEVLKNISMRLEPGRIYGLLGENGVGKTTLLTLLSGLKKTGAGMIDIDGREPYRRNPDLLADLYYLPDEVASENDRAENWAKGKGRFWPRFTIGRFNEIMAIFENDPSMKMNAMSSGQLKKTYISFALACGTRYLFLDEPTNALDIPSKAQFRTAILKFTQEDSTIVISTHQVRDLEDIIDPIIILDRQDVLLNATVEEISRKLYFDYSNTLNPASLYSEQLPGGFIQVYPNTGGRDCKVNVEALFNTVHKNKELIKGLFNNGQNI
ncbi:MAG TPA: ATP-binding cassette domain-containing protein [Candidatus Cryptobacteroides merdipullorum]|uniref:ATP-binding cassette domain-containing protein n=1 Tax=Candidatus Cryptobacteroides merdipullorum TaxID=2840771 RepID=A0A9D1GP95_9BACT|nr:ATP-binding cassette domain-containing protein [Candidatus Cryptobacteroides merdipullorum]